MKRLKKYKYDDFKDQDKLQDLWDEIRSFLLKRCETSDVGDLPVEFMLRSRRIHYPFSDIFLVPQDDDQIETAVDLQMGNLSNAMSRMNCVISIQRLLKEKK